MLSYCFGYISEPIFNIGCLGACVWIFIVCISIGMKCGEDVGIRNGPGWLGACQDFVLI